NGCHDHHFTALNLVRQSDLLFALQQRHGPKCGQIGAQRIIGLAFARRVFDLVLIERGLYRGAVMGFRKAAGLQDVFIFVLSEVLNVIYESHDSRSPHLSSPDKGAATWRSCRRPISVNNLMRCGSLATPVDSEVPTPPSR